MQRYTTTKAYEGLCITTLQCCMTVVYALSVQVEAGTLCCVCSYEIRRVASMQALVKTTVQAL